MSRTSAAARLTKLTLQREEAQEKLAVAKARKRTLKYQRQAQTQIRGSSGSQSARPTPLSSQNEIVQMEAYRASPTPSDGADEGQLKEQLEYAQKAR